LAHIGVVVLAGGRSSRFVGSGEHKLLAHIDGKAIIRISAAVALDSQVGRVVVVTGANAEGVAWALDGLDVELVHAREFAAGMSASLRSGVEALESADAIVVTLGDQPGLRSAAIRHVVQGWRETGAQIVIPRYDGTDRPAHPVLFTRSVYPELLALDGDVGARSVIVRDPGRVAVVPLDWSAPHDVDTMNDVKLAAADVAAASRAHHKPDEGPSR
jgi:molybdenum cofactor cytidylyltransferase